MITHLKNKVNEKVLLRNIEIVEQAISMYNFILKHKSGVLSDLKEYSLFLNNSILELPIGDYSFPCLPVNHKIDYIKNLTGKNHKENNYNYLIDIYNNFIKNSETFFSQNFSNYANNKIFIQKIEDALSFYRTRENFDKDFYNKIQEIYNFLTSWQLRRESFSDTDTYAYWRHDGMSDERIKW